jgi:hypothetical protein
MITIRTNICSAILAMTLSMAASAQQSGAADLVLGRWDLTIHHVDGDYPSWLEIRLRTERQLMAEFVGRFGSMRHASAVSFEDGRLDVRIPVQYEGTEGELAFIGQIDEDRLIGVTRIGVGEVTRWTAVRAPSLVRPEPVSWGEPVSLISHNDTAGWRPRSDDHPGCWAVSDGVLSATPPCIDLISERRFDDFRLHVEFRYPEGSNSGVYLRGRYEVQIQDDHGKALDPLRLGGVYGFIAPTTDSALPAGEWQSYDMTLIGRRVAISLNGTTIISDTEIPGITGGALDSNEGTAGPLMLQGDHGPIEYRNIVIEPAN